MKKRGVLPKIFVLKDLLLSFLSYHEEFVNDCGGDTCLTSAARNKEVGGGLDKEDWRLYL